MQRSCFAFPQGTRSDPAGLPSSSALGLTQAKPTQLVIPTQEEFEVDLAGRFRLAVQRTLQIVLDDELERLVGAGPYQRSDQRVDVRNGGYDRRVVTTAGGGRGPGGSLPNRRCRHPAVGPVPAASS